MPQDRKSVSAQSTTGSTRRPRRRPDASPVTKPEFRRGLPSLNKGLKLPAEVLTPAEIRALMACFGTSSLEVRNRALVRLLYSPGLKMGQALALQRRHYEPGSDWLTIPETKRAPERRVEIDATSQKYLEEWLAVRRSLGVRPAAPLFCTTSGGLFGPMYDSGVRAVLARKARKAGIDKRVSAEGLRRSGEAHRARPRDHVEGRIEAYVNEEEFGFRYPAAYETWRSALEFYRVNPTRHATRIGHDCREALLLFSNSLIESRGVPVSSDVGTVTKVRQAIAGANPLSRRVRAQLEALVGYWGTVSDLAHRQEHGAARDGEALLAEDARRLVFHTMLVMYELDRALG
jgi:Phage integrase family